MKIVEQSVEVIATTPSPEALIERCGRICYQSDGVDTGLFIQKLVRNGHHSVIEHAVATLLFIIDRGISHELVRHRLASYSQESTRYCQYDGEIVVIEPPGLSKTPGAWTQWFESCLAAERAYISLLSSGYRPQIARSVLPTCLKTQIAVTANLREWRHIFTLRCGKRAHPQIRRVMLEAGELLKQLCPNVFYDMDFASEATEGPTSD